MKRLMALAALLAGCATAPALTPPIWSPDWFPLNDGDVWIYRHVTRRGGFVTERLTSKTARPQAGRVALIDPDADDYLFTSDAGGLRLHGEIKPGGKTVRFEPPLEYCSPAVMAGEVRRDHKAGDRVLRTTARAREEGGRLVLDYAYEADGGRFEIRSVLVRGVGPVERRFRLLREGAESFSSDLTLVAARVGGRPWPAEDPHAVARFAFDHAQAHRDTWPADFAPFTGTVTLGVDGVDAGSWPFSVTDAGRTVRIEGCTDPWVLEQVKSMMDHRRHREPGGTVRGCTLRLREGTDRLAIEAEGDSMGSRYEIDAGVITSVSRLDSPRPRFRIDVKDVRWTTSGRYLPTRFILEAGGMTREVEDEYVEFAGASVPSRRCITTAKGVKELRIGGLAAVKEGGR